MFIFHAKGLYWRPPQDASNDCNFFSCYQHWSGTKAHEENGHRLTIRAFMIDYRKLVEFMKRLIILFGNIPFQNESFFLFHDIPVKLQKKVILL